MPITYAITGFDINTESLSKRFLIPSEKVSSIKANLGLPDGLLYFDIELEKFKAQEILAKLGIRVKVNDYDWFLEEYIIEENHIIDIEGFGEIIDDGNSGSIDGGETI